jgi:hypothetical protein
MECGVKRYYREDAKGAKEMKWRLTEERWRGDPTRIVGSS